MKRIFKGLFILLFVVLLSACTKDYKAITYTKFIDTIQTEDNYFVNKNTTISNDDIEKYIEASGNDNQFIFYEFKSEEKARNYVSSYFGSKKGYKDKKDYIVIKNSKDGYFYLIQKDKMVLIGNTSIKSNKKEINRIFKQLGY